MLPTSVLSLLADVKDLTVTIAAALGAFFAWLGLSAWRAQLKGKAEWELARRFARAVYKVRDAIDRVRVVGMTRGELTAAVKQTRKGEAETGHADIGIEPVIAAYEQRWLEIEEAWSDLSVERLEGEVMWGKGAPQATQELQKCVVELSTYLTIYIDSLRTKKYSPIVEKAEGIIFGDPKNEDDFGKMLKKAVATADDFLSPKLELPGASSSSKPGASSSSKPSSSKSGPSAVARIGLLVAVVGLGLYIWEINKEPVVELELFSPKRVINEITFDFKAESSWSEPLKLSISLVNKGNYKSESQILSVTTSPTIKAYLLTSKNWAQKDLGGGVATYSFEDRILRIPSRNRRAIGSFNVQVPKTSSDILLAFFYLQGDFEYNFGLIYYSPEAKKYIVNNFENPINAQNIWNEHLSKHFQDSTN